MSSEKQKRAEGISNKTLGEFFGLLVHDLRNPTATIMANISFLQEVLADVMREDKDLEESLADMMSGLQDLKHGIDQVAWIGRSIAGEPPLSMTEGTVKTIVQSAVQKASFLEIDVVYETTSSTRIKGAEILSSILFIFFQNSRVHASDKKAKIFIQDEPERVVFEIFDNGSPLAEEYKKSAFTLEGQNEIKNKSEGRYGRVAGLVAAKALADSIQATIETDTYRDQSIFRLVVRK